MEDAPAERRDAARRRRERVAVPVDDGHASADAVRSSGLTVPLGTVFREWGRIGVTGFGGPPATSRCCASWSSISAGGWTEMSSRRRSPPATCCRGPLDAAGDLLRLPGGGPARRAGRRPRVHRARGDLRAAAVAAVPGVRAAALDPRRRGRRRGRGRSGRSRGSVGTAACRAGARPGRWAGRAKVAGCCTPLVGHRGRDRPRPVPGDRPARLWPARACLGRLRPSPHGSAQHDDRARRAGARRPGARHRRHDRRYRRAGLGGLQGRRPVVRRRLRDHPADAARRRDHLPLDVLGALPERGRARPDHPRTGGRDGGGRRLRRPRRGRRRDRRGSSRSRRPSSP